jgi:hypothetical protein
VAVLTGDQGARSNARQFTEPRERSNPALHIAIGLPQFGPYLLYGARGHRPGTTSTTQPERTIVAGRQDQPQTISHDLDY